MTTHLRARSEDHRDWCFLTGWLVGRLGDDEVRRCVERLAETGHTREAKLLDGLRSDAFHPKSAPDG